MKKLFANANVVVIALAVVTVTQAKAKAQPPKNIVSIESARSTAKDAQPGEVQREKLENEDGKWVYSFDMKGSDSKIHEVEVDAVSGKLVTTKAEVDDEAGEAEDNGTD